MKGIKNVHIPGKYLHHFLFALLLLLSLLGSFMQLYWTILEKKNWGGWGRGGGGVENMEFSGLLMK